MTPRPHCVLVKTSTKWAYRLGLAASAVALAAGAAAVPASASPGADISILGGYYWNADGFTGELDITSQANGNVQAVLNDSGQTEFLTGTWNQSENLLIISRPIGNGVTQTYFYTLGGSPYSPGDRMFGGYYQQTGSGAQRGTYLDSAMSSPASQNLRPAEDTSIIGKWHWNADGYTGTMNITNVTFDGDVGFFTATLTDNGATETIQGDYDPGALDSSLGFVRVLPNGAGTQQYSYWLGGTPYSGKPKVFGGSFGYQGGNIGYGTYLDSAI